MFCFLIPTLLLSVQVVSFCMHQSTFLYVHLIIQIYNTVSNVPLQYTGRDNKFVFKF